VRRSGKCWTIWKAAARRFEIGSKRELFRALYAKHGDATFEARQAICFDFEQAALRGEIATSSPDVDWRELARQLLRHGKN
jgi:hypothetical protein